MFDDIKKAIQAAKSSNQKIATLHLQVLLNAKTIRSVDPKAFCIEVGVKESFATEVRKMLAVDRLMTETGKRIK
jgi:hypothetical protein